jgi:membrane-associated HD superfamily phosphohydrolase
VPFQDAERLNRFSSLETKKNTMKAIAILFRILWVIILLLGVFLAVIANRDINQGDIILLVDVSIIIFFEFFVYKLTKKEIKYKKTILFILSLVLLLIQWFGQIYILKNL